MMRLHALNCHHHGWADYCFNQGAYADHLNEAPVDGPSGAAASQILTIIMVLTAKVSHEGKHLVNEANTKDECWYEPADVAPVPIIQVACLFFAVVCLASHFVLQTPCAGTSPYDVQAAALHQEHQNPRRVPDSFGKCPWKRCKRCTREVCPRFMRVLGQ